MTLSSETAGRRLDLLANGVRWQPGDEVLLVEVIFLLDVFPWLMLRRRGVLVRGL
jgi:selenocysteine lyase/cysteine desulfurase